MNNFSNTDGLDNIPGVKTLKFIPVQHVDLIPDDVNTVVYDEIVMEAGKGWYDGEFTPGKLEFGDDGKLSASGNYHTLLVNGFHANTSALKLNNFRLMEKYKFIILVEDFQGHQRIVGTLESPCDFSFKETSGKHGNQVVRGYEINFSTECEHPAFYYDNESEPPVGTGFTVFYPDGETIYQFFPAPAGETFTIPYSSNMIFKHYLSDDPAIAGGSATERIFEDFIGYDINHLMMVITGTGLIGQLATLSAAKKILTGWNPATGLATFKSPGPAADNQITVLGYSEL